MERERPGLVWSMRRCRVGEEVPPVRVRSSPAIASTQLRGPHDLRHWQLFNGAPMAHQSAPSLASAYSPLAWRKCAPLAKDQRRSDGAMSRWRTDRHRLALAGDLGTMVPGSNEGGADSPLGTGPPLGLRATGIADA